MVLLGWNRIGLCVCFLGFCLDFAKEKVNRLSLLVAQPPCIIQIVVAWLARVLGEKVSFSLVGENHLRPTRRRTLRPSRPFMSAHPEKNRNRANSNWFNWTVWDFPGRRWWRDNFLGWDLVGWSMVWRMWFDCL